MRKIIFLIMLLSVLTSCNKDNSNPVITDNGLIGTWVLTNIRGTTPQGSVTISPDSAVISMTIIMNSDKTGSLSMIQQGQTTNQSFTWITLNGNIILTPTNGGIGIPLSYTKTGNKINVGFSNILPSISYHGVTVTSLILEFTKQ